MKLLLGTDIRTKTNIPYQNFIVKNNFGGEEVIIMAERNEVELFKNIQKVFCTSLNKMLIQTSKIFYVVAIPDEIKQKYLEEKIIVLAIIDKNKKPIILYELGMDLIEIKTLYPVLFA